MKSITEQALDMCYEALSAPEWSQDDMICHLTNIARLLAAAVALEDLDKPCQ